MSVPPAPSPEEAAAVARRALPLLDLTDLSEACTTTAVAGLCRDARADAAAAVCVWPRFVAQAADALRGSAVRIATVVNFPEGGEDALRTVAETETALAEGAHEIDLVLPYRALMRGDDGIARAMCERVRAARGLASGPQFVLKVILETGVLAEPAPIARAGRLALDAGADFLKTSTGKTPVSATVEAADAMFAAIRESGRPAGLKVSGGLRTVADAARYLALADRAMGAAWVGPATFRIGASSLHRDLVRARDAGA